MDRIGECSECERLWTNYSNAILQTVEANRLGKVKEADQQRRREADSAWYIARTALEGHKATHVHGKVAVA